MGSAGDLFRGFRLGPWEVRPAEGVLASKRHRSRLEPLLMDLLVFLSSRSPQVASKDDLLEHVWHGRFVSDDTVKSSVYQLRKALSGAAAADGERYIETIPKRGYRLRIKPTPLEGPHPSTDAADQLCSKGQSLAGLEASVAALKQARVYFERALELDPGHVGAASGLAAVLIQQVALGAEADLMPRALELAARVVERDPAIAAGHTALAIATLLTRHDVTAAEQSFRRALRISPKDPAALRWYAKLLSFAGRHDDALSAIERAIAGEPLARRLQLDVVEALFMARRYAEAIARAQELLRAADAPELQLGLAWIHVSAGDDQRAFESAYAGFRALGVVRPILDGLVDTFTRSGIRGVLRGWVDVLESQARLGQKTIDAMVLYALLGENDHAFAQIDRLIRAAHPTQLWIPVCPVFDGLRSDPRYPALLRELGLHAG